MLGSSRLAFGVLVAIILVVVAVVSTLYWTVTSTAWSWSAGDSLSAHASSVEEAMNAANMPSGSFKCYVINMAKNADRWHLFQQSYAKSDLVGVPLERVEAVDGRAIEVRNYTSAKAYTDILTSEGKGYRDFHYQLTRGAVGCYLSHMDVLRRVREGQEKFGIVFEDDAVLKHNIMAQLVRAVKNVPGDWDMLNLDAFCIECDAGNNKTYSKVRRFFNLHAYVITKDSAKKLLEYLSATPIEQQIDHELSHMAAAGAIRIYVLNKPLARPTGRLRSTIQTPAMSTPWVNDLLKTPVASSL